MRWFGLSFGRMVLGFEEKRWRGKGSTHHMNLFWNRTKKHLLLHLNNLVVVEGENQVSDVGSSYTLFAAKTSESRSRDSISRQICDRQITSRHTTHVYQMSLHTKFLRYIVDSWDVTDMDIDDTAFSSSQPNLNNVFHGNTI